MKKLLITREIPLPNLDKYEDYFSIEMLGDLEQVELLEKLEQADYLLACQIDVDESLLKSAPKLRAVNSYGVGYDSIDLGACKKHQVVVCNTPNSVTQSTAELALGLMISVCRRIPEIDLKMRTDTIEWGLMNNLGVNLFGRRLGIVGLGRIGRCVAKMAHAMGMDIYYYNRQQLAKELEEELQASYLPLDGLLASSDIISLHTPYSESSHHLMDKRAFDLMKRSAFLINTARGPVVDEDALVKALEDGQLAGAGLDVFEKEPQVHPGLKSLANTVLLPHIGTDTIEVAKAMATEALDGFLALAKGRRPDNIV